MNVEKIIVRVSLMMIIGVSIKKKFSQATIKDNIIEHS